MLLMALAGVLILALFGLMLYDVGLATKEKTEIQGATDFAALTQASVKARSMNMMAYGNISKRSIWATHSLYPAHMRVLGDFVYNNLEEYCEYDESNLDGDPEEDPNVRYHEAWDSDHVLPYRRVRCEDMTALLQALEVELNPGGRPGSDQFWPADKHSFRGGDHESPTIKAHGGNVSGYWGDFEDEYEPADPDGGNFRYHLYDLRALDNHQRFVAAATPWWAWTEQLMHGLRNGATVTASVPAPPGLTTDDALDDEAGQVDRLPVLPPEHDDHTTAMDDHIRDAVEEVAEAGNLDNDLSNIDDPFVQEHVVNNLIFVQQTLPNEEAPVLRDVYECDIRAGCSPNISVSSRIDDLQGLLWDKIAYEEFVGDSFFDDGTVGWTREQLEDAGNDTYVIDPWELRTDNWSERSSNIVFGYMDDHRDNRGIESRERYDFFAENDPLATDLLGNVGAQQRRILESVGYWGMARSEVTFVDPDAHAEQPDLWHPAWTARLRPVSLPGDEFDGEHLYRHIDENQTAIGNLQNRGIYITDFAGSAADEEHGNDFARMRLMLEALDEDTSQGVVK